MSDPQRSDPRPFHGDASVTGGRPRILLVSWHFPPAGTTGALRWQKLARYADERGWGMDVVTRPPEALERVEWPRMDELPDDTRVYGVASRPSAPERLEKLLWPLYRRLRSGDAAEAGDGAPSSSSGAGAPDIDVVARQDIRWRLDLTSAVRAFNAWVYFSRLDPWARDAAALARRIARAGAHRVVVSCGPPHAAHVAGRIAAERTGLPYVMDMRDPWSLTPSVRSSWASPLYFALARSRERASVARASLVVTNTEPLRIAMRAAHCDARSRVITVMNGYDDERPPAGTRDGCFRVSYAGAIYLDRDPRPLFEAAARVVREMELSPERFCVEFMGHAERFGGVPVSELAERAGLNGHVSILPPASRDQALEFMARSAMLVSLPQHQDMAIPSKIFEYMSFPAWILAMARRGSATELLLKGSDADVVDPDDVDAIATVLRSRFLQHERGDAATPLAADARFSRQHEAGVLLDALEGVTGPPGGG